MAQVKRECVYADKGLHYRHAVQHHSLWILTVYAVCRACEDRGNVATHEGYSQFDKVDIANYYMQQNGVAPTKHM